MGTIIPIPASLAAEVSAHPERFRPGVTFGEPIIALNGAFAGRVGTTDLLGDWSHGRRSHALQDINILLPDGSQGACTAWAIVGPEITNSAGRPLGAWTPRSGDRILIIDGQAAGEVRIVDPPPVRNPETRMTTITVTENVSFGRWADLPHELPITEDALTALGGDPSGKEDDQAEADLTAVTEVHIAAYLRAATIAINHGAAESFASRQAIRAGLAAAFATPGLTCVASQSTGEDRPVDPKDAREGDTIVIRAEIAADWTYEAGLKPGHISVDGLLGFPSPVTLLVDSASVTRPTIPLPDHPKAVIECRIVGKPGHYIAERHGEDAWLVAGLESPCCSEDIQEVIDVFRPLPGVGVAGGGPA
jgi:hypothetical protein